MSLDIKVLFYDALSLRFGGGFEHWVLELAPRLRKFGISSRIVCTKSTVGDQARFSGQEIRECLKKGSVEYFELPYRSLSAFSSNSPIPKISEIKRHVKDCDIIYFCNAYAFQDILIYFLKSMEKKPVVSGQHATLFADSLLHNLYVSTIDKKLLKRFNACHVLNSYDWQILKKWGIENLFFVPIGVDAQRFRVEKNKRDHEKFRVLFVGRLTPQKGIDILCKSIVLINKNEDLFKSLEFVIVGSGSMEPLVQEVAGQYDNIHYLRRVTDEALLRIYSNSNLFVMPSRRETFGIVALEAQACQLPVIASNIPGPSDIIINNLTGTLIRKESPKALAAAVMAYYGLWLKDLAKYKQICVNARDNVVKRYDWNVITGHVYEMLMNVARQGAAFN